MLSNKSIRWTMVIGVLVLVLAAPKPALAWSGCGPNYVVQWGDTLGSVADKCGTSVQALRQANPYIGDWLYAGQTITIPGGYQDGGYPYGYQGGVNCYPGAANCYQGPGNCYTNNCYQAPQGCYGYPSGGNCYGYQDGGYYPGAPCSSNCFGSQNSAYGAPWTGSYVVQPGDTLRVIADRLDVTIADLQAANPQLWNPAMIYVGQVLCVPFYATQTAHYGYDSHNRYYDHTQYDANHYTVQAGESLKDIARKFDTTQEALLDLNRNLLGKPGRISKGMVILIR